MLISSPKLLPLIVIIDAVETESGKTEVTVGAKIDENSKLQSEVQTALIPLTYNLIELFPTEDALVIKEICE